ncbi:MAG: hypothetical protein AB1714_30480 [Acidobacteriota bacterium]
MRSPDRVVLQLAARLGAIGQPIELKYLSSRTQRHRWAARSFRDLRQEFECKAVWVAKFLRDAFGPPDHIAYLALVESRLVGMRAAAWALGGAVVYVSLRRLGPVGVGRKGRPVFDIVLGAMRPRPPTLGGSQADEARDAVFLPTPQLIM